MRLILFLVHFSESDFLLILSEHEARIHTDLHAFIVPALLTFFSVFACNITAAVSFAEIIGRLGPSIMGPSKEGPATEAGQSPVMDMMVVALLSTHGANRHRLVAGGGPRRRWTGHDRILVVAVVHC